MQCNKEENIKRRGTGVTYTRCEISRGRGKHVAYSSASVVGNKDEVPHMTRCQHVDANHLSDKSQAELPGQHYIFQSSPLEECRSGVLCNTDKQSNETIMCIRLRYI